MAQANISLAIAAGGSDVASAASDAILLGSNLQRTVIAVLDIAQITSRYTQIALAWCIIYNTFAIILASGALVRVRIEPQWAGLGEVVSVLPVIGVACFVNLILAFRKP